MVLQLNQAASRAFGYPMQPTEDERAGGGLSLASLLPAVLNINRPLPPQLDRLGAAQQQAVAVSVSCRGGEQLPCSLVLRKCHVAASGATYHLAAFTVDHT